MLLPMSTIRETSSERLHFGLTVGLLAACAANLALVCAWLMWRELDRVQDNQTGASGSATEATRVG